MSKENVGRFFRFLCENKECQSKVKRLGADPNALADYARELGYDFSPEELQEHRNKALQLIKKRAQEVLQQPDISLSPGALAFYKFVKLAETDGEVSKRVAELAESPPQAIIAYGKEKGFIFNEQDMQTFCKNILDSSDELNDDDLELVAGGDTVASRHRAVNAIFGYVIMRVLSVLKVKG